MEETCKELLLQGTGNIILRAYILLREKNNIAFPYP